MATSDLSLRIKRGLVRDKERDYNQSEPVVQLLVRPHTTHVNELDNGKKLLLLSSQGETQRTTMWAVFILTALCKTVDSVCFELRSIPYSWYPLGGDASHFPPWQSASKTPVSPISGPELLPPGRLLLQCRDVDRNVLLHTEPKSTSMSVWSSIIWNKGIVQLHKLRLFAFSQSKMRRFYGKN